MSTQNTIRFDSKKALSFLRSRQTINQALVGHLISTTITGNGTLVDATDAEGKVIMVDGQPLKKIIYNTKLNSSVAMENPRNKQILVDAMAAEKAGNFDEASDKFRDFLNAVQVSFSVWASSSRQFNQGQPVAGTVSMVTTPKGSLLKLDNVYAPQAQAAAATTVGSIDDLLSFGNDAAADTSGAGADDAAAILAGAKA